MRLLGLSTIALASLFAAPLAAQVDPAHETAELTITSAEQLDEVAARIPEQDWYPEGYYDIRIAFAADYPEAERARIAAYVTNFGLTPESYYGEGPIDSVNLGDCDVEDFGDAPYDSIESDFLFIAKDMTYFSAALDRVGWPAEIYGPILLDYERNRLAEAVARASGRDMAEIDFEAEFGIAGFDPDTNTLSEMMDRLNAARVGEHSDLPEVVLADGCGGESPPVILRTAPGNGQVWIISAFAFRVCTRKLENPWDKFECRWNEVETGAESGLGGRYVYEVIWPDGTSRRGTREIRGDVMTWEPRTITFRKTGS